MPNVNKQKVGEVHRVTVTKTSFEKFVERVLQGLQVVGGIAAIAVVAFIATR